MRLIDRTRLGRVLVGLLIVLCACSSPMKATTPSGPGAGSDIGSFPYHPLVYHLDLSILAYQLYSQTLVWPFDPYYEEMTRLNRDHAMAQVRAWARKKATEPAQASAGLDAYRGPGALGGFDDNPRHDPILYRYAKLHPWSNSITNALGSWTEYTTPRQITGQVRDVYMCTRTAGRAEGTVSVEQIRPRRDDRDPGARDVLLAFEGGTGDKGEPGQPASQSLMGFVLVRTTAAGRYDVHVAFRGSRSGSGSRALRQAFSEADAAGNPDWITDLGYDRRDAAEGTGHISMTGAVARGFAQSMKSILPQLSRCLVKAAEVRRGAIPDHIYVTGHSLGGALAQHFVSAVLLGDQYGPGGAGTAMPAALRGWPWKQVKLVTYSAPRSGDELWARTLTETGLDANFFSSALDPVDRDALAPTDPRIAARLTDPRRPAGFRALLSRDPLTSERVGAGGKHVGTTVYANAPTLQDLLAPPDLEAHEPMKLRQFMVDSLADPRIPATAWRYLPMTALNPDRNDAASGSAGELSKLADAVRRYHADRNTWFDRTSFDEDVALRLAISRGP
jgi:hypothetical protein